MELTRTFKLVLLTALSPVVRFGFAQTAALQRLPDIDVAKAIESAGGSHSRALPVLAIRFSPDGRKLAVIADWYGAKGSERSRLLVFDVLHPTTAPESFEIGAGVDESEDSGPASDFGWSPSGNIINAGGRLVRLSDGGHCDLPSGAVLVGDNLAIAPDASLWNWSALASKLELFNTRCEPLAAWDESGEWAIADVSLDRGFLSVVKTVGFPNKAEDLIADPTARKIVRQWSGPTQPGGWFADSGRAICGGGDVEAADRVPVTCWEVDSGGRIAQAPTINGGEPIASAVHASRIVASDYHRRRSLLSAEYTEVLRRRVVWDFRAGRELVSWRPQWQTWDLHLYWDESKPPLHISEPYRFAISPDGEYIAEGGDGKVHLYRIAAKAGL
jgi:hypothetical protein